MRFSGACVLLLFVGAAGAVVGGSPENGSDRPYFDKTQHRVEYAGPGREDLPPADVREILLGYFGPSDPTHPEGGDLWLASGLAVAEANDAGGYRGLPFRLVPAWSENPWGTGVAQVARLAYVDRVWAVIGSIDGTSTHLAEQVAAKVRLTLVSPAATDKTVNFANVAWMFSCLPSDDAHAQVLSQVVADRIGSRPFTLISATDHDSHAATVELTRFLERRSMTLLRHLEFEPGSPDLSGLIDRVVASDAEAVVILAGPVESARLVVALRDRSEDLPVFGGPSIGRTAFRERAGSAGEGISFPSPCAPVVSSEHFGGLFLSRFGRLPDCTAAQAYDATRLVIEAIRKAGLNRARIRDSVEALAPWDGSAGTIDWSPLGRNRRDVRPATIRDGRVVLEPPPTR
jgi:branched-chain amino acid transport system substrate-binding protein